MSDKTTLLPCPFCGGEAEIKYSEWVDSDDPPNTHHVWSVGCAKRSTRSDFCLGRLCQNRGFKDRDEAIAAWNTRTATTDTEFARAVHDGNLWRRVKGHIQCQTCGLNIESVIPLDGCNKRAIKFCPNCGKRIRKREDA